MSKVKLFSGTNSEYLAKKIALEYGKPLGEIEIQKFSDGKCPRFSKSRSGGVMFS